MNANYSNYTILLFFSYRTHDYVLVMTLDLLWLWLAHCCNYLSQLALLLLLLWLCCWPLFSRFPLFWCSQRWLPVGLTSASCHTLFSALEMF